MPSHKELANAIRVLSMDAVERAKSGHPGAPMGMADIAEVLWGDYLRHNPSDPAWPDRDRFVLSNGHASMLLYSLLYLSGYDLSIEEIKNFRQLGSKTPGHPEHRYTPGVETTTGPLGQGIANAVGMALAEKLLAARFNRDGFDIVNHYTYLFIGDGCLMEGISHEACSLAGTLKLPKLIAFYDDNGVSIDGNVCGWFTDDTPQRFRAYQWHVIDAVDGHDRDAVVAAIEQARVQTVSPTLICCKTRIGSGAPNKEGSAICHGAPLGADEAVKVRENLGWQHPPFVIPDEIRAAWDARQQGERAQARWKRLFEDYRHKYPQLASEFERRTRGELPALWNDYATAYIDRTLTDSKDAATRKASGKVLEAYQAVLPELVGGSADLASSNLTLSPLSKPVTDDDGGNYIYFGVREFAMTAIASGLALHKGFIPYTATFLTFSDYTRNAVRMAALMRQGVVMIYTHDSIGLGEDGPTHQPVEHLSSLRLVPDLDVWRPSDGVETAVAWKIAIESRTRPCILALSRQTVPALPHSSEQLALIARGGYVLADCEGVPALLIIATGAEVALAMKAKQALDDKGYRVRVVSMPCVESFERQDDDYRRSVLPEAVGKRLILEAGVSGGWYRYAGPDGKILGIDCYGESAPGGMLFEHFGFTLENVLSMAEQILS